MDPSVDAIAVLSPTALRIFQTVQGSGIRDGLQAAQDQWRPSGFIHGDLRVDNVLVGQPRSAQDSTDGPTEDVRLVDWELSGRGDPRWDVGAALADAVICSWGRFGTELSLPVVQAAGRTLRRGYTAAMGKATNRDWPEAVTRFAAAHLVLAALAEARTWTRGSPMRGAGYLQVARNWSSGMPRPRPRRSSRSGTVDEQLGDLFELARRVTVVDDATALLDGAELTADSPSPIVRRTAVEG